MVMQPETARSSPQAYERRTARATDPQAERLIRLMLDLFRTNRLTNIAPNGQMCATWPADKDLSRWP